MTTTLPPSLLAPRFSHYAAQRLAAQPALAQLDYDQAWSPQRLQQRLAALNLSTSDEAQLCQALRQLRQEVFLSVMERDLRGTASLDEVTHSMTWLAETTVQAALRWATTHCTAKHGVPLDGKGQAIDLLVIGMGKLGGRELNVSSDIDLIFAYLEDGHTQAADNQAALTHQEFFERVGRKVIALLADVTADGCVFRVDMRLRPYGDAGPLVSSLSMLENYFITQGREWERYAWLKARVISAPVLLRDQPDLWRHTVTQLDQLVRPFVYRRYLDFGAIEALRDLHGKIKQELGRRTRQHQELRQGQDAERNIKLGRGGIREIEFIAQVFQLIRGGRDPALRVHATQAALLLCADRGHLDPQVADALLQAYRFLRQLEHCLQYRDDAQTHLLPADRPQQDTLAAMMRMEPAVWQAALVQHRGRVQEQFDQVFGAKNHLAECVPPDLLGVANEDQLLQALGQRFDATTAQEARSHLEQIRNSGKYLGLPEQHRQRFERLIPALLARCATVNHPVLTLRRALDLLETIGRRGAYLALLCEYPQALERVVRLLDSSSWAATYLLRHPLLLDELVDPRTLYAPIDLAGFETNLRALLAQHHDDPERQMDGMREAHHTEVFRLLLQDLEGILSVETLADYLSALADRVLQISLETVWTRLRETAHSQDWPVQPRFAIIGYGKLGGKELGYASDLDLIFLYAEDHPDAQEHYARLAQRLTSWLSSQTRAGLLFEIDLRLRPNGNAGLLVSSLPAFARYQREAAWVWEHQALTRARFCAGDAALGTAFQLERDAILQQSRDAAVLKREVLTMRAKMHDGHRNPSALFDIKHDAGGMVDIEFCVQTLVLLHSAEQPALTANLGNIALLGLCAAHGLIPPTLAQQTANAYRHFRALQHQLRLDGAPYARVEPALIERERAAVMALWEYLFGLPGVKA
ncbi:MAG: bifunctional [glutamate--ammonia ligase]-adenylyl-L-tyrosine phosphorylase/[glutamate--ammonia-ligase] adenylyltransferase [Burkholderiaceae bacterium]|nr:MAG: bifunctional [glutamate--ammonia ligase]-adenylyl-L-tyrosine phosphorylase/[glutamate--ammonia-ligase] adenylyltransferase [Burkholderiaceae bacterium]